MYIGREKQLSPYLPSYLPEGWRITQPDARNERFIVDQDGHKRINLTVDQVDFVVPVPRPDKDLQVAREMIYYKLMCNDMMYNRKPLFYSFYNDIKKSEDNKNVEASEDRKR